MSGKNQHVVTHNNGWAVRSEGGTKPSSVHDTQQEAVDKGREVAHNQKSELVIHGRDGKIRVKDSHSN